MNNRPAPRLGPWFGHLGCLTWNASVDLYEMWVLGRHPWWWRLHRLMRRHSRGRESPARLIRRLRGDDPGSLAYGETPAVSMRRVLEVASLPPGARVLDLGSGRGIPALTAACSGHPTWGLEFFEAHVELANLVAQGLGVQALFEQGNMLEVAWPEAELVHISSTAFPEKFRSALEDRLMGLREGTLVVTQDWLLEEDGFARLGALTLPVTWGTAYFCLHRRV